MSAEDWLDDVTEPDEEDDSPSLFEENFEKMIEDDDLDSMAVKTLEDQVERIDDPDLLERAIEADDRTTAVDAYEGRLDEIEANPDDSTDEQDDTDELAEDSEDSGSVGEEGAEGSDEADGSEVADGSGSADEVQDEVSDDEPEDPQEEARNAMACTECDDLVKDDLNGIVKPFDTVDGSVVCEDCQDEDGSRANPHDPEHEADPSEDAESDAEEDAVDPDPDDGDDDESADTASSEPQTDTTNLPEVDVGSLAPSATSREEAADAEDPRTLLVWGPEGSGKSHVAHSAPEPIAYIDTEGKATELAEKFDKEIVYWRADDYEEAKQALDEALDLLDAYLEAGVRGTLVVDSMTAMWEYAKVDYAEVVYQTDDLSEVNFQSQLEGEKDWTQIKARHNDRFRETILEAPFNVVFTAGQKEDYNAVFEGDGKKWIPDGEKWNRYAVKDVVRLRRDGSGRTVADLRKAAKTRYSFMGLLWPEWGDIYGAIDQIHEADQAESTIDLDDWEFDVVDGQPVAEPSDDGGEDGEDDE